MCIFCFEVGLDSKMVSNGFMKILKVKCIDQVGIISKISTILLNNNINIIKLDEYVEPSEKYFFFRAEIEGDDSKVNLEAELESSLGTEAQISLSELKKKKVVIMATKESHCLGDLLLRGETESLNIDIQSVIANHDALGALTKRFEVPFHFISHIDLSREDHAQKLIHVIDKYNPDYIILAKYMRILPPEFVNHYKNKVINIHHSFLPAFIGANPYKQAFKRGVKIIGASSHFVTADLDEGPIIEQNVLHIDHSYSAKELSDLGRDVEQQVLAKALKYVTEDRVFVHNNKTIVFK
jgi:formyltetrahydrofolate deformylase